MELTLVQCTAREVDMVYKASVVKSASERLGHLPTRRASATTRARACKLSGRHTQVLRRFGVSCKAADGRARQHATGPAKRSAETGC